MSSIARLEVIPQTETSMSEAVARAVEALDQFDVSYETTPTDTIVEAEDSSEVFAAAEAAHRAVEGERVVTSLEIDDQRTRTQRGRDRVESVERRLGRPARRRRDELASEQSQARQQQSGQTGAGAGSANRPQRPGQQTDQSQQTEHQQGTEHHRASEHHQQTEERRVTGQRQPTEEGRPQRYGGPWHAQHRGLGGQSDESVQRNSRYLHSRRSSR